MIDKYQYVKEAYMWSRSIFKTAQNTGLSTGKIRKILLTAGIWENDTSIEIDKVRHEHPDWNNNQIADFLNVSVKTVQMYTPYELEEVSEGDAAVFQDKDIADEGKCGENVFWSLTRSGKLTLSGQGEMWDYTRDFRGMWKKPRPGWWMREDNVKVNEVIIGEGITTTGEYSFADLTSLRKVSLPDSLTELRGGSFLGLNRIKEIVIPENTEVIGWDAFYLCIYLEKICIPAAVSTIKSHAFHACASLKSMYFYGDAPKVSEAAFNLAREDIVIYHREGTSGWGDSWQGYKTKVF